MTHTKLSTELEVQALALLESFSEELCKLVGNAHRTFRTVDVRQSDSGPHLEVDGDTCIVVVGPNAAAYEPTLVANLAHESVHLHFTGHRNRLASGLEEGFAVRFELMMVEMRYGHEERLHHINHLPKTYKTALADYAHLETMSENPAMLIRTTHGRLSGLTPHELRRAFPSLGWMISRRLARCKQMRA
jgi:hypothetical protein